MRIKFDAADSQLVLAARFPRYPNPKVRHMAQLKELSCDRRGCQEGAKCESISVSALLDHCSLPALA